MYSFTLIKTIQINFVEFLIHVSFLNYLFFLIFADDAICLWYNKSFLRKTLAF